MAGEILDGTGILDRADGLDVCSLYKQAKRKLIEAERRILFGPNYARLFWRALEVREKEAAIRDWFEPFGEIAAVSRCFQPAVPSKAELATPIEDRVRHSILGTCCSRPRGAWGPGTSR